MLPDRAAARTAGQQVGVALDEAQADRLLAYLNLLRRWNATYNLTAVHEAQAMWVQHVMDCLAAVPSVAGRLHSRPGRPSILDVGSGGGLPGVVWAIALPGCEVTCIDTVGKKAAFIRQAAGELGLSHVRSVHGRVEGFGGGPFDLITSRAFASLRDFTRLTRHLLAPGGCWVAMKGKFPADELAELALPSAMFHVEPLQVPGLGAERCLVWIDAKASGDKPLGD